MREKLLNRLHNWKFNGALQCLEGSSVSDKNIIVKLAEDYGNIGWVMGKSDFKDEIETELQKIDGYEAPSLFGLRI